MKKTISSTVVILLAASTLASADVFVDALKFSDGTRQITATLQGPEGLQGAPGPTGPPGTNPGPIGPQGPKGDNCTAIEVTIASICKAIYEGGLVLPDFCRN
ncbi:MAG: hypothetical protein ACOYL3_09200 [Desulfuromonadaceae bacterium]